MCGESNPFDKVIKKDLRDMKKTNSAINEERSAESSEAFSEESQENFGKNERGSEDVIDMYANGAFD